MERKLLYGEFFFVQIQTVKKAHKRVHVYVAHYVIFLLLVERQLAYLSKSSKKQILETIIFNL